MPLGLIKWLDLLAARPLPVMAASLSAVKSQMANPHLSLVDYASSILDDPALAAALLKKANLHRQSVNREPLTTLSNALSHLGRSQLEQQLAQLKTLDKLGLAEQNAEGYKAAVAASCHASSLALDWALERKIHEPEEMQLAALLQCLAEMSLWCHGGKVMPEIEARCYGQSMDYDQAAEQVLGCSIRALGAALANAWAMPELVVQSLELKAQDFTLATGVMLASRLARLTQHNWQNKSTRGCLDDIAHYKGHSLSDIEPRIYQNAVALSDHFIALGLTPPARFLPMLADENYIDPKYLLNESGPATVTEKLATSASSKDEGDKSSFEPNKTDISSELANKLTSIRGMIKQRVKAGELIQAVVEAIQLSGFERVVFAVNVPEKKLLHGRFFANGVTDRLFKEFKISIAQPNIFTLLMNKPQHLWINDDNRGKFWSRIPDLVKHQLQNDSFMMMSIVTDKHSVGLMYADAIDGELTQKKYQRFQSLCRLLTEGMVEISHHGDR